MEMTWKKNSTRMICDVMVGCFKLEKKPEIILMILSVETGSLVANGSEDGLETRIEIIVKSVILRPEILTYFLFFDPCNMSYV